MFVVYLPNNKKHSAWNTRSEAKHQVETLINNGYGTKWSKPFYEFDETVDCENGHYYV